MESSEYAKLTAALASLDATDGQRTFIRTKHKGKTYEFVAKYRHRWTITDIQPHEEVEAFKMFLARRNELASPIQKLNAVERHKLETKWRYAADKANAERQAVLAERKRTSRGGAVAQPHE